MWEWGCAHRNEHCAPSAVIIMCACYKENYRICSRALWTPCWQTPCHGAGWCCMNDAFRRHHQLNRKFSNIFSNYVSGHMDWTIPLSKLKPRAGHSQATDALLQMVAMTPTVPYIQSKTWILFVWTHTRLFNRRRAAKGWLRVWAVPDPGPILAFQVL